LDRARRNLLLGVALAPFGAACERARTDPAPSAAPPRPSPRASAPRSPSPSEIAARAFDPESPLFSKKLPPRPGDWLERFREPGQSFFRYRHSDPVRRTTERHTLVMQPLGAFDARGTRLVGVLRDLAAAFFDAKVELARGRPLPASGRRQRREGARSWTQHHTRVILDELEDSLPPHALCVLGVTLEDLYPEPSWNFVFGQATLEERVGVYSLARFFPEHTGEPRDRATELRVLQRSLHLLAHETGHMFSLEHCVEYECLMNGSNSLEESDRQVTELCPVCLQKLHHALGFDVAQRYERLLALYRREGLAALADWIVRRLSELRAPVTAPGP
jgi:archaemetzincin